ncbi:mitotic-spindle organizing protein [Chloropicon roscoffensis]|uniref:Mitotic-spindle organizing protein n=1 Tax=Chloropicon roscoffensis TaxID=1461544 RepID=A0AAX4P3T1_9CHLO|eukprot:CAMPEP_0198473964 /NCGR_PEP_ID=MMETSP1456-20131121/37468_1 /TAXON_ID=1461544 ORGANISM="Unidentified sp., Strain RCC1871" /NCGR_SAMPLE_ID=MMETSP1456 /ASSEMBLY_ACC=CAM_ASM_001119 /LENGTH=72 /DNA_ID=CAMNT_0044200647 /DNA_START=26 /DNA_END=244 /DNA_ORIENTATION=-
MVAEDHGVGERREDVLDVAFELSQVLDTGLDRETLSILIALCENGVNPEALALVVKELKRESQDFRAQEYVS